MTQRRRKTSHTSQVSSPYWTSCSGSGPSTLSSPVYGTPNELDFPLLSSACTNTLMGLAHRPVRAFRSPFLKVSFIGHSILPFLCCIGWKIFRSMAGRMTSSALKHIRTTRPVVVQSDSQT